MSRITLRFGDTRTLDISGLVDGSGNPTTFQSGDVLAFTVKRSANEPDSLAILKLSSADGDIVVDVGQATGVITVKPEHWQGARSARDIHGVYDVQLVRGTAKTTLATGRATVQPDVTHA